MSLMIPPGHHFLRLAALTPTNCGDTGGSAVLDRPVAVDAWSGLPYLPYSALKGVLAGRRGNVQGPGGGLNTHRTQLFGAPDLHDDGKGRAGPLVFGDAEVLAFPLLLRDGRRAMVTVAATVRQLAHRLLPAVTLHSVDETRAWEGPIASADLPMLPEPLTRARFGINAKGLQELLGTSDPVIIAAPGAARWLWQTAIEERTLTALGEDRLVRDGSLRTVELIPAGTHFVSLVSNLSDTPADLGPASPLQLGAWEGTGCGYFAMDVLTSPLAGAIPEEVVSQTNEAAARPLPRHEIMRTVFRAMRDLKDRPEALRARSAIFDLGPRLAQRGLAVTLAFCLAKAGGGEDAERLRTERAAYRWILGQLFAPGVDLPYADLHARAVGAIGDGRSALPSEFHETRLWLRRYAETLLPKEKEP